MISIAQAIFIHSASLYLSQQRKQTTGVDKEILFCPLRRACSRATPMETSLLPAIGDGIGRKIVDRLIAEGDFIESMVTVAKDGLKAMTAVCSKDGVVMVVDQKTRNNMFFGLLEQMDGKPVERILTASLVAPGGSGEDLDSQLAASPAMRAAMRRRLEKADRAAARSKQKGAPVIEMEP